MSKQLEIILDMVGANYPGCHNCKFYDPNISWDSRSNECKVCIPSNWKPDKITKIITVVLN